MNIMINFTILLLCLSAAIVKGQPASSCCQEGWSPFRGSCYMYADWDTTWARAASFCLSMGAKLAEVETLEENDHLKSIVRNKNSIKFPPAVWLGATDVFKEGAFQWMSSGRTIDGFKDWSTGQPDNSDKGVVEHCLTLTHYDNWKWNDYSCNNSGTFICERRTVC